MELINEQEYADWSSKNTDPYGSCVFRYVERWANLMEGKIAKGENICDIAEATGSEADTEGITGFMYGCAMQILAVCWVYGEELRRWHNLKVQLHDEGEKANESGAVLNPALISIG